MEPRLAEAVLAVCRREIAAGAREIGGNNSGPFVAKYLRPTGLLPPQPWCAAFVSWCIRQAARHTRVKPRIQYSASSMTLLRSAAIAGLRRNEPAPGSLVFWGRGAPGGGLGHVGIVEAVENGVFHTIEGNRTSRVQRFAYPRSKDVTAGVFADWY
jgi:hypothetical protein